MSILESLQSRFTEIFGHPAQRFFSAPGRTELGGNHTDHQHGLVLAAAVDLRAYAAAAENGTGTLRLLSEGYPACEISLFNLAPAEEEQGKTVALLRGIASQFALRSSPTGLDVYITSQVLPGSGLSSSAAIEILLGAVLNAFWCDSRLSAIALAQIGQYAENVYFGKPCGLMDQLACAFGGIISVDFSDSQTPEVEQLAYDLSGSGYALCIIDVGADHADLTAEYAAIPDELAAVCAQFGASKLREIPEDDFYARLPALRGVVSDRALLRAIHVYEDNRRVRDECQALQQNDFEAFLRLVNESGLSSWTLLQNIIPTGAVQHQETALALTLCRKLLGGRGACRIHGGGFGGTIQAFVPQEEVTDFTKKIEQYLTPGCCHILRVSMRGFAEEKE